MSDINMVGYSITFTENEDELLLNFLKDNGYSLSKKGIKDLLLDIVNSQPEEKTPPKEEVKESKLNQYLKEHPEALQQGAKMLYEGLKLFRKRA